MSTAEEIVRLARDAGRIGLDTEFMGEGRYRTQLCLVQLAVPDGEGSERIEILDPLDENLHIHALAPVLEDPGIELVVHAGRQDIALLRRQLGCEVRGVFDTQVAAGFIGLPAQCSYETLLIEALGIRVKKSASFTRWDRRPLSDEQLAYAREDVVHLLALAHELERRLEAAGRLDWAREECEYLERVNDDRDLDAIFAKLPRVRGLSLSSQGVARELVQWREETAAARDRPVQSILGDTALVEIAKRKPSSRNKLEEIRGVGNGAAIRRADELLDVVARGLERPVEPLASTPRPSLPESGDAPLIALCESLVRARAREADLAYELLASRADLQAVVTAHRENTEADVRTLRGWRRTLVGEQLLALLDGNLALAVQDGRIEIT